MSDIIDYQSHQIRELEQPPVDRFTHLTNEAKNDAIPKLFSALKKRWWYYALVAILACVSGYWVATEYGYNEYDAVAQVKATILPYPPGKSYFTPPTIKEFSRFLYDPKVLGKLDSENVIGLTGKKKPFEEELDPKTGLITIKLTRRKAIDAADKLNGLIADAIAKSNEERQLALVAAENYYTDLAGKAEVDAAYKRQLKYDRRISGKNPNSKNTDSKATYEEIADSYRMKKIEKEKLEAELADARNLQEVLIEEEKSSVMKILSDIVDGLKKKMGQSRTEFAADSRQAKELDRKIAEVDALAAKGATNYEELLKLVRDIGQSVKVELEIPVEAQFMLSRTSGSLFEMRNKIRLLPQKVADATRAFEKEKQSREESTITSESDFEKDPAVMELTAQIERAERNVDEITSAIKWVKDMQLLETPAFEQLGQVLDDNLEPNGKHSKFFALAFGATCLLLGFPLLMFDMLRSPMTPSQKLGNEFGLATIAAQQITKTSYSSLQARDPELRLLALRIQQAARNSRGSVVLFSSLSDRVSTRDLTTTLARCLVAREEKVLIIDLEPIEYHRRKKRLAASDKKSKQKAALEANPNRSMVISNDQTMVKEKMGLAMALAGKSNEPDDVLVERDADGIDRVQLGGGELPVEAFATPLMSRILDSYRNDYSMVLLSGPAAKYLADVQMLASRCDGTLFVAPSHGELSHSARRTIVELIESRSPIMGIAEVPG